MNANRIISANESKRETVVMNCCVCMDSIVCVDEHTSLGMLSDMGRYSIACSFVSTTCRRCKDKIECAKVGVIGDGNVIGTTFVFQCPSYKQLSKMFAYYPKIMGGNMHTIVHTAVAMNMIPSTYVLYTTMMDEEGNAMLKPYEIGDFF